MFFSLRKLNIRNKNLRSILNHVESVGYKVKSTENSNKLDSFYADHINYVPVIIHDIGFNKEVMIRSFWRLDPCKISENRFSFISAINETNKKTRMTTQIAHDDGFESYTLFTHYEKEYFDLYLSIINQDNLSVVNDDVIKSLYETEMHLLKN